MDKDVDLNIFKSDSSDDSSDITASNTIKRLLTALSYYDKLDTINNTDGKILFSNFMDQVYGARVYDDFNHLTNHYGDKTKSIMDLAISKYGIPECELSECKYSNRHYRVNEVLDDDHKNNNEELKHFNLHKETMDSLYFYIYHLRKGGFRYIEMINENENKTESDSPYFDALFDKMSKYITKSNERTNRFNRLSGNKYNISAVNDNVNDSDVKDKKPNDDNAFITFCITLDQSN